MAHEDMRGGSSAGIPAWQRDTMPPRSQPRRPASHAHAPGGGARGHPRDTPHFQPAPPLRQSRSRSRSPPPTREAMLKQRLVELDAYAEDLCVRRFANMTREDKIREFGSTMLPIPVPLARGETRREYEVRFEEWLSKRNIHLMDIGDNPHEERKYRMIFANLNAKGTLEYAPLKRKRLSTESSADHEHTKSESKKRDVGVTKSERDLAGTTGAHTKLTQPRTAPSASGLAFPTRCTFEPSPDKAPLAAVVSAFIACGCRICLLKCTSHLASEITAMSRESAAAPRCPGCTEKVSAMKRSVVDLTYDDDGQSPRNRGNSKDVARLVLTTSVRDVLREHPPSAAVLASMSDADDPIEKKLQDEYDEINERIIANERVLHTSTARLRDTSIVDLKAATLLQDEHHELRELIGEEIGNRNAALAILIVYMWRHKQPDLEKRIHAKGSANVVHIQRAAHRKCAKIATELAQTCHHATKLKQQLDEAMASPSSSSSNENDRVASVRRLGQELTSTETAIGELVAARRKEIATLIQFDDHIRHLLETLLAQA